MILGPSISPYTYVNMTWHEGECGIFVEESYFALGMIVWFFNWFPFIFSTFYNNYIREIKELIEKWIFVRIFRDKRTKKGWKGKDESF